MTGILNGPSEPSENSTSKCPSVPPAGMTTGCADMPFICAAGFIATVTGPVKPTTRPIRKGTSTVFFDRTKTELVNAVRLNRPGSVKVIICTLTSKVVKLTL